MLQQGALVREGEVEAEVAAVLTEAQVAQEMLAAVCAAVAAVLHFPLLDLHTSERTSLPNLLVMKHIMTLCNQPIEAF